MSEKERIISIILDMVVRNNEIIRSMKDEAAKFSLDLANSGAYNARIGYRVALNDVLAEVKIRNVGDETGSDLRANKES